MMNYFLGSKMHFLTVTKTYVYVTLKSLITTRSLIMHKTHKQHHFTSQFCHCERSSAIHITSPCSQGEDRRGSTVLIPHHPQSGRSMVEMLGVLAVIGVLSVTAIGGYRYGMDKYHANEILKGVSARAMTASMEKTQTHTLTLAGHADDINGYTVGKETAPGGDNTRFAITVSGVPESICDLVLRDGPENALYVYGGDGTVTSCSDVDNTLAFIFNDNLSTTFKADDYNGNEDGCTGAGYTLCADDTCRADCCAGVDTTCQTCAADGTVTPKSGSCATASIENGVCSNGACVANLCLDADVDAQCQSCDSVTGEITDTITCNNHGTCSNGSCSCDMGYSTSAGMTTCTICSAGTYAVAGSSSCTPCAAGYYAAAGSGSCTQCGENTYSLAGAGSCTPCESGKTSPAGSTSASACVAANITCLDGTTTCPSNQICCPVLSDINFLSYSCSDESACYTHSESACSQNCNRTCIARYCRPTVEAEDIPWYWTCSRFEKPGAGIPLCNGSVVDTSNPR